jgi:hypothetical protein
MKFVDNSLIKRRKNEVIRHGSIDNQEEEISITIS